MFLGFKPGPQWWELDVLTTVLLFTVIWQFYRMDKIRGSVCGSPLSLHLSH